MEGHTSSSSRTPCHPIPTALPPCIPNRSTSTANRKHIPQEEF